MRTGGFALSAAAILLAACSTEQVVVLPAADGHIGGVVVESGNQKAVLDKPYASAEAGSGSLRQETADAARVGKDYAGALAARPIPPKSYVLYFENDSDELVPESRGVFDQLFAEIAERKAAEIVITGHTDRVGAPDYNDQLSLDRANAVARRFRDDFEKHGIRADAVTTAGRGERDLLVQTADQVPEPRNRRVEITVR
jgi:outer membrane protein OmpA-like peptidoglycan-associated protein